MSPRNCVDHAQERARVAEIILLFYRLGVTILFLLLTASCGIGCFFASLFPDGEGRAHRSLVHWARISLRLARVPITVAGLERLDRRQPYVFMPNHASFVDILLVFACIPHNFRIVVKKEIFSIPFLGWAVKSSGQISLDRENPRKGLQSLKQASDLLKKGLSIVVFPEGTRSRDGRVHEFKATLFVLPIRTRTPVVPVLIEGTFEALPRGSVLLRRCPIRVSFLDPIPADSFSDKDRASYADEVRQSLISRVQDAKPGVAGSRC
jgi:1-acyl-sn-glycerol-3-phosphate acyltransferase